MSLDVFAALVQPLSEMTIHNVRLVDVKRGESGHEQLTVEHGGSSRVLVGGGRWTEDHSRRDIGRTGHLVPAPWFRTDVQLPEGACYFRAYIDQSPATRAGTRLLFANAGRGPSYVSCPRADGYGSNGSDERDYAEAWLQRAHGMYAVDVEEFAPSCPGTPVPSTRSPASVGARGPRPGRR